MLTLTAERAALGVGRERSAQQARGVLPGTAFSSSFPSSPAWPRSAHSQRLETNKKGLVPGRRMRRAMWNDWLTLLLFAALAIILLYLVGRRFFG